MEHIVWDTWDTFMYLLMKIVRDIHDICGLYNYIEYDSNMIIAVDQLDT